MIENTCFSGISGETFFMNSPSYFFLAFFVFIAVSYLTPSICFIYCKFREEITLVSRLIFCATYMVLFHMVRVRSYLNFIHTESFRYKNMISYFLFFQWHHQIYNLWWSHVLSEWMSKFQPSVLGTWMCLNSDHLLQLLRFNILCLNNKLEKNYYAFTDLWINTPFFIKNPFLTLAPKIV